VRRPVEDGETMLLGYKREMQKEKIGNSVGLEKAHVKSLEIAVVSSLVEKREHNVLWSDESKQLLEHRLFINLCSASQER